MFDLLEQSLPFLLSVSCIVGLAVGSFLNVVIYRLPVMMKREWRQDCCEFLNVENKESDEARFNLMVPRSSCPHCGHMITALENIPVISYLILKGKCSACHNKISIRYPIIEIISAVTTVMAAYHFGYSLQALMIMVLSWSLICLTMIDFDEQLLPDSITMPLLWLGILGNYHGMFTTLEDAVLGAVFGYLSFWSIYILFKITTGKEGMGHGDFKLLSMLGAWLGWQFLPYIFIVSSIVGALIGITLMVIKSHGRTSQIPFGPYIAIAGWTAIYWGQSLTEQYLGRNFFI